MSGIEANGRAVRGSAPALPLAPGTEGQVRELGLGFARALVAGAPRGPEELARLLIELGRLPAAAQDAVVAVVAQGRPEANPVDALRGRIAEAFLLGSERRHRLAEALALRHGLDPARLRRTRLESMIAQTLARIGPVRPAPRPAIQDVLEPSPTYGPFVAAPATPANPPVANAVTNAPPPLPPAIAPSFEPPTSLPATETKPPAPAPPPPPVYVPPSGGGKKKKRGFFRSLKKLFNPAKTLKAIHKKVKKLVKDLLPYIAMILQFIPLGWTQLLAAAIRVYLAIKAKNIMGIVAAVASFIPAVGAYVGGAAMNAAAQVASKVADLAKYAAQAMDAYSKIKRGDWLGGLAGFAAGAANMLGNFSDAAASTLRGWGSELDVWAKRLSSGMQAIGAARRGDFLGAFGLGANLAADLDVLPAADAGTLKQVAGLASQVGTAQTAIRRGDWVMAAGAVSGLAARYGTPELKTFANTVQQLVTVQRMAKSRDYLGAATVALRLAGRYPLGVETKEKLHEMADRLQMAGQAVARGRTGDFAGAAKELWKLGLSNQWDKETREALQKAANTFHQAIGVRDAVRSGDLSKAASQLAAVVALFSEEAATPEALKKLARRLQDSVELRDAVRRGDDSKVADVLGVILKRERGGDAGSGGGGHGTGGGSGDGADEGEDGSPMTRVALTTATRDRQAPSEPSRSLAPAVEEVIQLLNVWTRAPEERRILEIIRALPDADVHPFLTDLKVRGYLQKLFDDVHGDEYQELLRLLAAKGARAPLDESALRQVLQGILGGGAQFGRGFVDGIAALFQLQTYVGLADLGRTLFIAADPAGVFRIFAPQMRQEAVSKIEQVLSSARDKMKEEWQAAKAQGKEAELVARWSTQGILEVATFFVGVGEVKTALNATRLGGALASSAQRVSRLVIEAGGWKEAAAVVGRSRFVGVDALVEALKKFERTGDEQLLRNLSPEQLENVARALEVQVAGKAGPGELPFVIRYDPIQHGKPDPKWSIDTSGFTSGYATPNGGIVNARQFWKEWLRRHPETVSDANRRRIEQEHRSPRVDDQWVKYFPEHARLQGHTDRERTLHHHHVDHGPIAVPVPGVTHRSSGGPWHGHPAANYFDW